MSHAGSGSNNAETNARKVCTFSRSTFYQRLLGCCLTLGLCDLLVFLCCATVCQFSVYQPLSIPVFVLKLPVNFFVLFCAVIVSILAIPVAVSTFVSSSRQVEERITCGPRIVVLVRSLASGWLAAVSIVLFQAGVSVWLLLYAADVHSVGISTALYFAVFASLASITELVNTSSHHLNFVECYDMGKSWSETVGSFWLVALKFLQTSISQTVTYWAIAMTSYVLFGYFIGFGYTSYFSFISSLFSVQLCFITATISLASVGWVCATHMVMQYWQTKAISLNMKQMGVINDPDAVFLDDVLQHSAPGSVLNRLAFINLWNLAMTTNTQEENLKSLFSLSIPGGHPMNWDSIVIPCLREIETLSHQLSSFTQATGLGSSKDVFEQKVLENHGTFDANMPPHIRNLRLRPGKSAESNGHLPVSKESRTDIVSMLRSVVRKQPLAYLFFESDAQRLNHVMKPDTICLVSWCAQSLAGLARLSQQKVTPHAFGIAQRDAPKIAKSLITLFTALRKVCTQSGVIAAVRALAGPNETQHAIDTLHAVLLDSIGSFVDIFGRPHLEQVKLSQDERHSLDCALHELKEQS